MTPTDLIQRAKAIKLLLLDVDGVLTDGHLYYGSDGSEFKAFHTQDGHGIKMLQKSGVQAGIITGRTSDIVARRAAELGISILVQGREDKYHALQEILREHPFSLEQIAFMGDDWPDLSVMTQVGLALSVANAHPAVLERAHWVALSNGGKGAVREACDWLMQAQNTWQQALSPYLNPQHEE